jgi:hypothetical protein
MGDRSESKLAQGALEGKSVASMALLLDGDI